MRTFAFLVLLVNFAYFAWSEMGQRDDSVQLADQARFVAAAQALVLHSELPPPDLVDESLPVPGQQIVTISDPDAQNAVSPEAISEEDAEPVLRCEIVSGFADQRAAESFIAEIANGEVVGELALEQEQISSTWWVHLPPFASQVEAQRVIDELAAKGIDNFYMRTGELAGGISLGVFSREESATTAQAELRRRGYETSIREIPRYVSKAYVALQELSAGSLMSDEWLTFFARKTNLASTEKLCETIAR